MLSMPYSTQLVQEWQARTKKPCSRLSRTRLSEINSLKRESSREQHSISQPVRFHLAFGNWKFAYARYTLLSEINVESKWNFTLHLAPSSRKQRFKDWSQLAYARLMSRATSGFALSSLPARLHEIQQLQGIRSAWHDFIGQIRIFMQFAWAKYISLKRDSRFQPI